MALCMVYEKIVVWQMQVCDLQQVQQGKTLLQRVR